MPLPLILVPSVVFTVILLLGIIFSWGWVLEKWALRTCIATWVVMLVVICSEPILGQDVPVDERTMDLREETSNGGRIQFVSVDDKKENVTKASSLIFPYPGKVVRRKTERRFLGFVFGSNVTYEPAG